jgi:hypothetical protein
LAAFGHFIEPWSGCPPRHRFSPQKRLPGTPGSRHSLAIYFEGDEEECFKQVLEFLERQ